MSEETLQEGSSFPYNEFSTRLNEIEEKQRLIKDRLILIGKNFISIKEEFDKENVEIKKQLKTFEEELKELKILVKRIVTEIENFARKDDLRILERQFKIFEPLQFARIEDVERIIDEKIKHHKK